MAKEVTARAPSAAPQRHLQQVFLVPARYTQHAVSQSQVDVQRVQESLERSRQKVERDNTRFD